MRRERRFLLYLLQERRLQQQKLCPKDCDTILKLNYILLRYQEELHYIFRNLK